MIKLIHELDQDVCLKAHKLCEKSYNKKKQIDIGTTEQSQNKKNVKK